jgi:S1-C subfamily serine protease
MMETSEGVRPVKQTLYDILGVGREATPEEIAVAYRSRLVELEGAAGQDPTALNLVREAHQLLSNPTRRAAYDASLAARAARESSGARGEPAEATDDDAPRFEWRRWALAAGTVVVIVAGIWWKTRSAPPPKVTVLPPTAIAQPAEAEAEAPEPTQGAEPPGVNAPVPQAPAAAPPQSAGPAEDVFSRVSPSVVRVNAMDDAGRMVASGSGVVIDRDTVITNCHVLRRAVNINVKQGDAVRIADVQVSDEELDLCRLNVSGLGAAAVAIGSVKQLRTGQRVYAIGAPQGLELTISEGIVSSLREVSGGTVIQTTAPISAGSSGGGLFDLSGRLVGITTFQHRYGQNLNFALPADWIAAMQTRPASTTTPVPTARPAAAAASRGQDDSPQRLIVGQWWCFGSVSGRNGEYDYRVDGTVSVASSDGRRVAGHYAVAGRSVRYRVGGKSFAFAIEGLTREKMVLNIGVEGQRLVCDRR